ncbi:MAG: hypothetical protein HY722_09055 [Planctomycetes bacterium]|nr:hypothetical protein [Planctomycetota bacterium]
MKPPTGGNGTGAVGATGHGRASGPAGQERPAGAGLQAEPREAEALPPVAILGLEGGDDPSPGPAVARCLRAARDAPAHLVGLASEGAEGGAWDREAFDSAWRVPPPWADPEGFLRALREVVRRESVKVLVPSGESETRALVPLAARLEDLGVAVAAPAHKALAAASGTDLYRAADFAGLLHPRVGLVRRPEEARAAAAWAGLPAMLCPVSGATATPVVTDEDLDSAVTRMTTEGGLPSLLRQSLHGEELAVGAYCDEPGRAAASVAARLPHPLATAGTWTAVTIACPEALRAARRILAALAWVGSCEVRLQRPTPAGGPLLVTGLRPCLPTWVLLAERAGQDLASGAVRGALGLDHRLGASYRTGLLWARRADDVALPASELFEFARGGSRPDLVLPWREVS